MDPKYNEAIAEIRKKQLDRGESWDKTFLKQTEISEQAQSEAEGGAEGEAEQHQPEQPDQHEHERQR